MWRSCILTLVATCHKTKRWRACSYYCRTKSCDRRWQQKWDIYSDRLCKTSADQQYVILYDFVELQKYGSLFPPLNIKFKKVITIFFISQFWLYSSKLHIKSSELWDIKFWLSQNYQFISRNVSKKCEFTSCDCYILTCNCEFA